MRKWILLAILAIGMLLILAGCSGCSLTKAPNSTNTPAVTGNCTPTNTDRAETVAIADATFKMGSLPADPGAKADEQPQHDVALSCYNIYKKEVTNAMYNKCVATGACVPVQPRDNTPTAHVNDPAFAIYPVVGVDYNMASEYCAWAGGRLPTEAEWEYAARGPDALTYPWGNTDPICSLANSKGCLTPEDTEKVGFLDAGNSPFQLMDMAGNAWEWVFDWYAANGYSKSATTDPIGPAAGFWKVVRGGGYNSIPALLRAANRHAGDPYKPYYNVGFRCVTAPLTLPGSYVSPNPDLHQIPIDGPVDDDDPGNPGNPSLSTGILPLGCPDGNGNLHLFLEVNSPNTPQLGSFYLNGQVFPCTWDAGNHWYECVIQAPQTNDPTYSVSYCFHVGNVDQCMQNVQVPKPQNCNGSQTPLVQNLQVSCPNEGKIKVLFHNEPAVTWDLAQIDSSVDMDCVYLDSLDYQCIAPDILTNGKYSFHLHGTGVDDNADYTWYSYAPPNPDCSQGNKDFQGELYFLCNNQNLPTADMEIWTNVQGNPILQIGGQNITLQTIGSQSTGPVDPFLQGQTVPYAMGIDPTYYVYDSIAVPQCPQGTNNFQGELYFLCNNQNMPIADMEIWTNLQGNPILQIGGQNIQLQTIGSQSTGPVDPFLQGQTVPYAMGIDSSFYQAGSIEVPQCPQGTNNFQGMLTILCNNQNLPFADMEVTTNIPGDRMLRISSFDIPLQTTGGESIGPVDPSLEGQNVPYLMGVVPNFYESGNVDVPHCTSATSCGCRVFAGECLSKTTFGFSVQTCVQNPAPLVAQSVTANDGSQSYDCILTNQTGTVYCSGTIPSNPGPLTVCYTQQGSQDHSCCTMDNFASSIPVCTSYQPPKDCSPYKDNKSCQAAGCSWTFNTLGPPSCH
jgi:formylglycine-generating enzyme required for sulfatase activity